MARKRKRRTPPTPAQRRRYVIVGAALVAFACFAVLFEAVFYEGGRLANLIVASVIVFIVFILPIILAVRGARKRVATGGVGAGAKASVGTQAR